MKKLILIFAAGLVFNFVAGQDTLKIESEIEGVTVYKQGAQIKRSINKLINKGRTVMVIQNLSSSLDKNTIKVKANEGITVVSVRHELNFMNRENSNKRIRVLKDQQEHLLDSVDLYKKFNIVLNEEKNLLQANQHIGGSQNGVDIQNLKATAEFYRMRMKEIELQILSHNNRIKSFNEEIIKIARQLNELNAKKDHAFSELIIVLKTDKKQNAKLDFEYFTNKAGWKPYYDIRVSDVNNPVKIVYKAKIWQDTDIDWENTDLILSTGNPSLSGFKPSLTSYFLTQNNYFSGRSTFTNQNYFGYIRGKVTDNAGDPLPGVSINIKGTNIGTITDLNGNYSIEASMGSQLIFSYIGMETFEQPVVSSGMNVMLTPSNAEIEEVVVTGSGVSKEKRALGYSVQNVSGDDLFGLNGKVAGLNISGSSGSSDKVKLKGANAYENIIPMNIKRHETNREFVIDIPYTIRSDNKEYDLSMTEFELSSEYKHYAVPKLTEKVYLSALLTEWQEYGMLNGEANVFFKETYTGKTHLDLETLNDTIVLSLGIDNDVFIKREQIKEFSETKLLGTNRKESRAWKISVKNLKPYPIKLVVEDQIPVSKEDKIKVEKNEISGAVEDTDSGMLIWNLVLQPSKSEELVLKYSVKYPSYLSLIVD